MIQNIYTNFDTEYKKTKKKQTKKTKTKKTKNKSLLCSISFRYQDLC